MSLSRRYILHGTPTLDVRYNAETKGVDTIAIRFVHSCTRPNMEPHATSLNGCSLLCCCVRWGRWIRHNAAAIGERVFYNIPPMLFGNWR